MSVLVAVVTLDRVGRRITLYWGAIVMGISLIIAGVAARFVKALLFLRSAPCSQNLWHDCFQLVQSKPLCRTHIPNRPLLYSFLGFDPSHVMIRYSADVRLSESGRSDWGAVVAAFVFLYTATFGASWVTSLFNPSDSISQPVCLLSLVNRSLARAHRDHASVCTRQGWMCRSLLCFALLWAGFFFLANRSLIHSLLIRLVERGGLVDWKCGRDWDRTLSV